MTICIGAICDDGESVIMASDRMWTNERLSIEFEYPESKIESLSPTCFATVAGVVVLPTELFERVREMVDKKGIRNIAEIANLIKEEYIEERRKRVEDEIFKPRGIRMKDFYEGGLQRAMNPELVQLLDREVENYRFMLEILIGGIDKRAHLYVVFPPGRVESFDRVGYVSIGSGSPHAETTFILNNYTPSFSLSDALYVIYEAKRVAERAPGVGKEATDIVIITKEGKKEVPDELKEELERVYSQKTRQNINGELLQKLKIEVKRLMEGEEK